MLPRIRSVFTPIRVRLANYNIPKNSFHKWIADESRTTGTGEYRLECKKYCLMLIRIIEDKKLSGPASAIFTSQNSLIDGRGDVGIVAFRPVYGERIYAEDAGTDNFKTNFFQACFTPLSVLELYDKYLSSGNRLPTSGKTFWLQRNRNLCRS